MLQKANYLITEYQIFDFPVPIDSIEGIITDQNYKLVILQNLKSESIIADDILVPNTDSKMILQKHYNELSKEGKIYYQIFGMNKLLSKFFKYCHQEGYIQRNPCEGIKVESYKEIDSEVKDDIKRDRENIKLRVLIKFPLYTGLRQGKIQTLI